MYLILLVLHDPGYCDEVMDAWEKAGVRGITILPSTGYARMRSKRSLMDDMPLIPSLEDFISRDEQTNRTIFTVVEGEAMVQKVVQVSQSIIGDFNEPNTGILIVLPVVQAYGLNRKENHFM